MRRLACLLLPVLSACAGTSAGSGSEPNYPPLVAPAQFPDRGSLQSIAALQVPSSAQPSVAPVDSWLAERAPAGEPEQAVWVELVAGTLASRGGKQRITPAYSCIARELARFHLEHKSQPDESLFRAMVGQCGGTSFEIQRGVLPATADPAMPVEQLFEQSREGIVSGVARIAPAGAGEVGVWFMRRGSDVVVALVAGRSHVEFDADFSAPVSGQWVRVAGRVLEPSEEVFGLINQGQFGVARCHSNPAVLAPAFEMSCPISPADTSTWVAVVRRPPGHLLATNAAEFMLRRSADAVYRYQRPSRSQPVTSAPQLTQLMFAAINDARQRAGVPPLLHAVQQSRVNDSVSRQFFAESLATTSQLHDQIALGLMAGWDVQREILSGGFYAASLSGSSDALHFARFMLDRPMGRHVMLNPEAQAVALGSVVGNPVGGLAVVATTYILVDARRTPQELAFLYQQLNTQRSRLNRPPLQALPNPAALTRACQAIEAGQRHPQAALNDALREIAPQVSSAVAGHVLLAQSLEGLPFPPELLSSAQQVALGVCHLKLPSAAWSSYVVVLAFDSPSPRQQAAAGRGRLVTAEGRPSQGVLGL